VVLAARRGRLWLLGGGGGEQRVAKSTYSAQVAENLDTAVDFFLPL
jgi:hypothetical protein